MISLQKRLQDYLDLRRSLGFKLARAGHLLPDFLAYIESHHAGTVTAAAALDWAKQPADGHPQWWAERLGLVRPFARYLQAYDPSVEVPPVDLLPSHVRRAVPYLYADVEIISLMDAARGLRSPLRAATYATLIGLLSVTGLRIGEAIRLDRDDVNWSEGLLVIRNTKFGKSREIPLHKTSIAAMWEYATLRDRLCRHRGSPAFFLSSNGTRLIYKNVHFVYLSLIRNAGIARRSAMCRPRPHDLRHTFAVRILIEWYRSDVNVEAHLPRLSTYLGHTCPSDTYWYLSAAPELLALAAHRLETNYRDQQT